MRGKAEIASHAHNTEFDQNHVRWLTHKKPLLVRFFVGFRLYSNRTLARKPLIDNCSILEYSRETFDSLKCLLLPRYGGIVADRQRKITYTFLEFHPAALQTMTAWKFCSEDTMEAKLQSIQITLLQNGFLAIFIRKKYFQRMKCNQRQWWKRKGQIQHRDAVSKWMMQIISWCIQISFPEVNLRS